MDNHEKILESILTKLSGTFDSDDLSLISSVVTLELNDYELTIRNTDLITYDDSSSKLLDMYIGTILTEGKSKKTAKAYRKILERFEEDVQKPFVKVNTFDIRVWFANMQKRVSLRTCDTYRAYLSAFYMWLQKEEIIESNPMGKIKPIKYKEEMKMSFSDTEIDSLRFNCKTLRDRAIFELLLSSGIRVSEMCALNIEDIDFQNKKITIHEGKGGKERISYINDVCSKHLKAYIKSRTDDDQCLFITRKNSRLNEDSTRRMLKSLGKRSQVNDTHPHKFRRTFATNMYRRGMDIRSIQKILGHTNINTTMIYINTVDEIVNSEYRKYA